MQIEEASIPHLRHLLEEIGDELFLRKLRRRTVNAENRETGLRITVVRKLVSAIDEVDEIAKRAGRRTRKGHGGVSPKIRWYQLMAYLAQTLDGVLKNSDIQGLEDKMDKMDAMEKMLAELQRSSQRAQPA